ncbi:MAG: hypothetical protein KC593_25630 [Myxococcales bacterium]|nr:hypothetical protein [Myxococcales bacterium]
MTRTQRARAFAVSYLLAVGALGTWAFVGLPLRTEIMDFLPDAGDRELAQLSRHVAASDLNRTLTLTVEGPDLDTAAQGARALGERLAQTPGVAWVRSGPTDDLQRAFYELYFPRRFALLGSRAEADALMTPAGLAARAQELRERLSSPAGAFVRQIAVQDPWLSFLHHVERLRDAQQGELEVHDGVFVTERGGDPVGVVLLASERSPFDGAATGPLLAAIDTHFAAVNQELGGSLHLEQASVHRLAHHSETTIRADIQRVSIAGSLGVVLLLLLLFRSPRVLLLGAIPLVAGLVMAVAAARLLFGSVHGLTLAFGATLIGVAIDYVAHYLNHHVLAPSPDGPYGSLRRVGAGLFLGAATTIAGLSGLAWTSFPGIRQMALFTTVGVAGALVTTCVVVPAFMPAVPTPTALHLRLSAAATRALAGLAKRRKLLYALPLTALIVMAVGVPRLTWQDDIRALSEPDAQLAAEDARVRGRVARMEAGRFVIATGPDEATALDRNDQVAALLGEARTAGEIDGFRSLATFLPSPARQQQSLAAIPADAYQRSVSALEAAGFVPTMFAPFEQTLATARTATAPLTLADLSQTPLGQIAQSFVVPLDHGVAVLSFVTGVRDADALAARVEGIEGVRFFDQAGFMTRAYREFRERTVELVGFGLLGVLLLVWLRYRRVRPTLAAFLPALLATGATLGVLGLFGVDANLLHIVTLLLVLSMGVDYGVFMVETEQHAESEAPTVVSLLTACGSTVLSFGVLGLSAQPAMRAMGVTAAVGVGASLLLAPAAWLWARGPKSSTIPPNEGMTSVEEEVRTL